MDMHDVGLFVGKELSEPGNGERVPGSRERPKDSSEHPSVAYFVAVPGEFDDLVAVLTQQCSFCQIDRVFAAGGYRAIEIVYEKDFHWRSAFLAVSERKRSIRIDRDIWSVAGSVPGNSESPQWTMILAEHGP